MPEQEQLAPSERFYRDTLTKLREHNILFLLGGAFALRYYTGIKRDTKDLDLFCKTGDHMRILSLFSEAGCEVEETDSRWLAKIRQEDAFIDIIYSTASGLVPVNDSWFIDTPSIEIYGIEVNCLRVEELIWSKIYIQDRDRFDGADINHLLLRQGRELDWQRLSQHMEQHWQLLLSTLINFQFVYPADRDVVPNWLIAELLDRYQQLMKMPLPYRKVCQGPLLSRSQYEIDQREWGYLA